MTETAGPTRLLQALRDTGQALDARGLPWALVGGLAVSVRCEPRFTRDIDVAVAVPDDDAAETLVADLTASGFSLQLSLEQAALHRLAAVRLLPPGQGGDGIVVDVLFASSGIEDEICRDAERVEVVPGLRVPVAHVGHLIAMKLLALSPERPQDEADLRVLMTALAPGERDRCRAAVTRIETLGANRGKSLSTELGRWLSEL